MSVTDNDQVPAGRLLEEFPPHTYELWRKAAEELLKGAPFEKRLLTPTYEGFVLQPIYHREDAAELPHMSEPVPGSGTRVRGRQAAGYRAASWLISQELGNSTPEELNAVVRHELTNGQNELNLWLDSASRAGLDADADGAPSIGVCGVSASTRDDFAAILEGVSLPMISVYLRAGAAPEAVAALFLAAVKAQGTSLEAVSGCIEADPVAYLVETGSLPGGLPSALDGMAALARYAEAHAPRLQTVAVQGHPYHNGGASSVQEMAAVLATGVHYLRELSARGLDLESLAPRFRLSLSVGSQYFLEIAKFRAIRLLWSRVLEALGLPEGARGVHLHARTGLWNKTARDPYVNSLRTTTEAFAAVVGGVDSLHVGAFDEVVRETDDFSRRLARNVHHILAEECDMTKVIDPAGGSWAVEWLTDRMATQAWAEFQKIEAAGGIVAALEAGLVQAAVADTLEKKRQALAQRRDTLVGTNNYPNAGETPLAPRSINYIGVATDRAVAVSAFREARDPAAVAAALTAAREAGSIEALVTAAEAGATLGELHAAIRPTAIAAAVAPITLSRGAGPYEKLAARVAALEEAATLLQVNFGPSRRYRLRADWTSAFFRVAGFPVASDDDFLSIEDAVAAVRATPGRVALLVSDDATYAESATALARALKAARPDLTLILAGAPGEEEAAWREAGIDDFVHVRVSNYDFNEQIARSLEG
jgi:methylmalonyl-CoA mutase